jgi:PhnB protein
MEVNPVPAGYHTLTPYVLVKGGTPFIDFLKKAFNAKEISKAETPDGTIMNAEIKIGDSMLMLADAAREYAPSQASFYLYVENTDLMYKQAIDAGAVSIMEPADQFYGDRNAGVKDPFGNTWWIATRIEDVSGEEIKKRAEAINKN